METDMKRNLHGGNIHTAARNLEMGLEQILDLSASINPLGMPQSVQSAICNHLKSAVHYPDPDTVELTAALAAHYAIAADTILCGNGSTELIHLLARALRTERVLIPAPTFAEYEKAVAAVQDAECGKCRINYFVLKEKDGFRIDADAFITAMTHLCTGNLSAAAAHGCSRSSIANRKAEMLPPRSASKNLKSSLPVVFLCNPNNPTGILTSREDVLKIAHAAQKLRCYLVVDEAFADFCPEHSVIDAAAHNPYLIVLRSMTKFYALAGIRLGYGVFPSPLIRRMQEIREPWTVNTIAQIAGLAALEDGTYRTKTMKMLMREKCFLEKSLHALGIQYLPSAANYYLLKMPHAAAIINALAAKGIILRSCANFRGLTKSHVRIAVRSRRENTRFLKELSSCRL